MNTTLQTTIIEALDLSKLPPADQELLLSKIGSVIFQSVVLRSIDILDPEDVQKLDELVGKSPDDFGGALSFLEEKIPYMDVIAQEEVATFTAMGLHFLNEIDSAGEVPLPAGV